MEKAFDRAPHEKLLYNLEYLGFRNPLLHWIGDYLTNRRHRVSIYGISSNWKYVSSGVPQGSIIGPILFIFYINDIGSDLSPETLLPLYADDAKCSRVIRGQLDRDKVQQDVSTLYISASRTNERDWKPLTALEPSVSHCQQKKKT